MCRCLFLVPTLNERFLARDINRSVDAIVLQELPDHIPNRFSPLRGRRFDVVPGRSSTSYIEIGQAHTGRKALFDINMEYKT